MNQSLQPLKGFRDFLPHETFQREWLKNEIISTFKLWGYEQIESPTIELLSLFSGQIGDDEKLFYSFTDNGDRKVALRYDQTVPTCRVIGRFANEITFPFRRFQIQPVFRAEKPQSGRYREFLQCDADIFGSNTAESDTELIALGLDIYRRLGFPNAVAHINDRSLLANIPYSAISSIDKLDKIGTDGVITDMVSKNISKLDAQNYLSQIQNLQPSPRIQSILTYLKNYGFESSWYKFDPTIPRAFSYSQGSIWEIKIPEFKAGTVLGGERYDNLINKITNRDISASGFGLGFDRTLEAAIQLNLVPTFKTTTKILIACLDSTVFEYALTISNKLRSQKISTELYPDPSVKLGNQIKYASQKNIEYVAILGSDEQQSQTITLKNISTSNQQTETLDEIIKIIKSN